MLVAVFLPIKEAAALGRMSSVFRTLLALLRNNLHTIKCICVRVQFIWFA